MQILGFIFIGLIIYWIIKGRKPKIPPLPTNITNGVRNGLQYGQQVFTDIVDPMSHVDVKTKEDLEKIRELIYKEACKHGFHVSRSMVDRNIDVIMMFIIREHLLTNGLLYIETHPAFIDSPHWLVETVKRIDKRKTLEV